MALARVKGRNERGERRRRDIADAAFEVFLERGYAGASIDAVVERAGGSKETLYAHFGNKAGLLKAIIESQAADAVGTFDVPADDSRIEPFLRAVALGYLEMVLSPRTLALYRLVLAESGRMPDVGDMLYRSGPEMLTNRLAARLRSWEARGDIRSGDADKAAVIFFAMLRGDLQLRALFNPTRAATSVEIAAHADYVVTRFLWMCGASTD